MNEIARQDELIPDIVLGGDLSKLTQPQQVQYYRAICERLGLDPLTQPFKLLRLSGKLTLYCDRSGTAQLNRAHRISHDITDRQMVQGGVYIVTARAIAHDGRYTTSTGAVPVQGLNSEKLANALMKAETKAKRRATLDLVGLGMLDESELETIRNAEIVQPPAIEHKPDPVISQGRDGQHGHIEGQIKKHGLDRERVKAYVKKRWGHEHLTELRVSQFETLKAKLPEFKAAMEAEKTKQPVCTQCNSIMAEDVIDDKEFLICTECGAIHDIQGGYLEQDKEGN